MRNYNRVQAVINLDNIRHNVAAMKSLVDKDKKMLAVIKADAYGHGAVEVAHALNDMVDFLRLLSLMRQLNSGMQVLKNRY